VFKITKVTMLFVVTRNHTLISKKWQTLIKQIKKNTT
jgi:hypothetical protein